MKFYFKLNKHHICNLWHISNRIKKLCLAINHYSTYWRSHAHKPGEAGLLKSDSWQPMQYRFKLLWYRNKSSDCELWRTGVSAQTAWSWWHRPVQSGSSLLFFSRCHPRTLKTGAESVSLSRMFQLHFCLSDTVYHVFTPTVSQPTSVVIFLLWNLSVSRSTHSTRNQSNWVH